MAIYKPGEKFRSNKLLSRHGSKRALVAILSLTAMVDMFTVLVIFLLQSYSSTGEIIFIPKEVKLPKAEKIKELKPAVVVTISNKEVLVDRDKIVSYDDVQKQGDDWLIVPLKAKVEKGIADAKAKFDLQLKNRLRGVVKKDGTTTEEEEEREPWKKVTVQADKGIDFLSVKKVMYTVTEAGAGEINFAVMKETGTPD